MTLNFEKTHHPFLNNKLSPNDNTLSPIQPLHQEESLRKDLLVLVDPYPLSLTLIPYQGGLDVHLHQDPLQETIQKHQKNYRLDLSLYHLYHSHHLSPPCLHHALLTTNYTSKNQISLMEIQRTTKTGSEVSSTYFRRRTPFLLKRRGSSPLCRT